MRNVSLTFILYDVKVIGIKKLSEIILVLKEHAKHH